MLKVLVAGNRHFVVAQVVRKQCQRELRRPASSIAPLKPRRTVVPQVESEIEWNAVHRDQSHATFAFALVSFQCPPPKRAAASSAVRFSGCLPSVSNTCAFTKAKLARR